MRLSSKNANSHVMLELIADLKKALQGDDYYLKRHVLVLFDNASYHKSKKVRES
jgi:hypothetical protein